MTYSQMHNNIMAAGSRDRPPMLATERYAQWQSRFMRYVDTKPNGDALRKCILQGPYKIYNITISGLVAIAESPKVPEQIVVETLSNISLENKAHYDAEKEAIHLLLTRIGDEIYSTIDACNTTHDMWIAIERLQQGESLNKQDYQKEVNENRAKKIAKNANPLALVDAPQQYPDTYYQTPQPHRSYATPSKQSSFTRSHVSTKHKGKEIAKPITSPSETDSEEDGDPDKAQRDKDMQKNLALIAKYFKKIYKTTNNNLKTSLNSKNKNVDTTLRYVNENQTEQVDWLEDTDKEINKQELEAHYSFITKIQEVLPANSRFDAEPLEHVQYDVEYNVFANERQHSEQPESINDTHVVEKDDNNVISDSSNMCDNDNQADQNVEECDDKHMLANLISNLKLDTDENKKNQKQLKKANTSLSHDLEECKYALKECKSSLKKSNRTRDRYLGALHNKEVELEKYKIFKDRTIKKDTLESKLNKTLGLLAQKEHDITEGVIHKISVNRTQPKSTQMKDKVVHNNSQVKFKKTEVEDHHRIFSISNKTKSVTAYNDSLKSITSNVNAVCATYGKLGCRVCVGVSSGGRGE
nr:integrase, catalytic region, zinc finger, CCHC-type, peptidase aspartic, catalytic [Tanacetum cinerariifolium]